jgi:hypothetical protein
LEQARSENELPPPPPPFIKPATPKKDKTQKQPRRKRAKDQNGARRRETPTQTIQHKLEQCPTCRLPSATPSTCLAASGDRVAASPAGGGHRAPAIQELVPRCGKWHYASVDLSTAVIGQSRIGVRIVSLIAYLRTCLRLPVRLIREYLLTVHNLMLSTGQITDLLHRVAEAEPVQEATHQICQRVRHSPIVHGDETVWREEGQNGYVWSFSTPEGERYFQYDKSRAGAVAKRILGSDYKGTLVSDFYAAYNDFPGEHQRCWAHLLRDLHALKEMHKENGEVLEWTAELRKLYDQAQELVRGGQGQPHQPHNSGKLPTPTQLKPQGSWHASTPTPKSMLRTPAIPSLRGCCCTWTACSSSCGSCGSQACRQTTTWRSARSVLWW